ncbi:TRAP transporter permease [Oceanobacillus alkalisoli]|uniref:TRAP transporter permease n=1 Tax=Oceanobacillus alkalisoli TaxID=2925113 RepID=UPI001EE48D64|nr:TRAP transporter permease [Oceanobacillus alkalisoli]MCG5102576.1 TRAP transporter permease [Oceanobacillus alkalisoli]
MDELQSNSVKQDQHKDNHKDVQELDRESNTRDLKKVYRYMVISIAVAMSLFHIYALGIKPVTPWILYSVHLGMGAVLVLFLYPMGKQSKKNSINLLDAALILLTIGTTSYLIINGDELVYRIGINPTNWDVIVGAVILVVVLEITRRTCGLLLPIIAVIFIVYARFGEYVPGILGHRGYSWERIISYLKGMDAIFSVPLAASATFVFLFIVFSSFVQVSGAGKFFIDFAMSLTGKTRGGPAKTAVVGSALFGTITGNSVANVVSSGAFTIPLMKQTGYKARFAAAVEAVASTGGQIMPPILGSAAFIMAMLVGVPYSTIVIASIIPAFLYFTSILIMVDFEAAKKGLKGLPASKLPEFTEVMKRSHLIIPLLVLIFILVILQFSPIRAALWAIATCIIVSLFRKDTRMNLKKIVEALSSGAQNALQMIAACATAGIIIGVLNLTGSGLKFASVIISLAGDMLPVALVLTMIATIILGMGLPTTAAYLITAAVITPALVELGVDLLIAHMFVFYFACLSAITPPIALASYAGAGIAKAKPLGVSFTSVKLGLVAFIIPYMFVYGPSLLGIGSPSAITLSLVTSLIGVFSLGCALQGWFWGQQANLVLRGLLLIASIVLIYPGVISDLIGFSLILVSFILRYSIYKYSSIKGEKIA